MTTKRVLARLVLGAACMAATSVGADTVNATLVDDVYLASNTPASNFDDVSRVSVGVYVRNNSAVSRAGFLRFTLPALSPGQAVVGAKLTAYCTNTAPSADAVVVALLTNPTITGITWNSATADATITGRDGTDYRVLWGSNAVDLGQRWPVAGWGNKLLTTYNDTTPGDGLAKFISDHISTTVPTTLTLGFGGPSGVSDYSFGFYSMEAWNDDATPTPGIFAPILQLTIVPEPGTGLLAGLLLAGLGLGLGSRRRGGAPQTR